MFTKMHNLQKQIDIVTDKLYLEWQKIQWDHGRHWQTKKLNRFAQTVKDYVPEQSKKIIGWYW